MRRQQGNCRRASIWTSLVWRRTPSRISIPCYRPLAASSLCMHRINEVPIHISKHSFRLDSSECYVYPTCIYHTHILRHHEQIHFCFFFLAFLHFIAVHANWPNGWIFCTSRKSSSRIFTPNGRMWHIVASVMLSRQLTACPTIDSIYPLTWPYVNSRISKTFFKFQLTNTTKSNQFGEWHDHDHMQNSSQHTNKHTQILIQCIEVDFLFEHQEKLSHHGLMSFEPTTNKQNDPNSHGHQTISTDLIEHSMHSIPSYFT